jgi:hypothetical protein
MQPAPRLTTQSGNLDRNRRAPAQPGPGSWLVGTLANILDSAGLSRMGFRSGSDPGSVPQLARVRRQRARERPAALRPYLDLRGDNRGFDPVAPAQKTPGKPGTCGLSATGLGNETPGVLGRDRRHARLPLGARVSSCRRALRKPSIQPTGTSFSRARAMNGSSEREPVASAAAVACSSACWAALALPDASLASSASASTR